jgi:hypothetical protein
LVTSAGAGVNLAAIVTTEQRPESETGAESRLAGLAWHSDQSGTVLKHVLRCRVFSEQRSDELDLPGAQDD